MFGHVRPVFARKRTTGGGRKHSLMARQSAGDVVKEVAALVKTAVGIFVDQPLRAGQRGADDFLQAQNIRTAAGQPGIKFGPERPTPGV